MELNDLKYLREKIALLTKHKKAQQIQAVLSEYGKHELVVYEAFDTDQLGSFDGVHDRELSPQLCALKKAKLACEYTGLKQGIGSEGSFNGLAGIGNSNEEIIAFVDLSNELEVFGVYRSMIDLQVIRANDKDELLQRLNNFPSAQAWMLQSKHDSEVFTAKGLIGKEAILNAIDDHFPAALTPDFRAMHCPRRQENIIKATQDLMRRLGAECPNCGHPNFVDDHVERGLPCELCLSPTKQVKATIATCGKCGHQKRFASEKKEASSFYCDFCNP